MTISVTKPEVPEKPQDREVVLSVQGVSKKFCRDLKRSLFYGVQDIASELVGRREKSEKLRKKEFWALKDVSFEVRRGEALGLVGPNGSGKTTLMRIIAGLIRPDTGSVEIQGRVAPLIALGAGFNPILTGRENIYANMAILGLSKQEIDERFDAVVEFAEIGDAINAPVQTYSSGMAARLGFASAIHTEPEILLIDEVLAVGDIKFRGKCSRKLAELREQGTSFILVSHNTYSILSICKSAVYLSKGQLVATGQTEIVVKKYEEDLFLRGNETPQFGMTFLPTKIESESTGLDIIYLGFKNENGNVLKQPITGENTNFCIGCKVRQSLKEVSLTVVIRDVSREGEIVLQLASHYDKKLITIGTGNAEIQIQMPYISLIPGIYEMKVFVRKMPLHSLLDSVESFIFKVKDSTEFNLLKSKNLFYQPRNWKVINT